MLRHMRESGAIEQDADIVMLLSRGGDPNQLIVDVAKHRNGPTRSFPVYFDRSTQRIRDWASNGRDDAECPNDYDGPQEEWEMAGQFHDQG